MCFYYIFSLLKILRINISKEKMIKDYIIKEILGVGAFGTVYKVQKKSDDKIYVIKKISLIGLNPNQIQKAKLESKILSNVQSPYLVKYYESFEENNFLNIVMEYCDGGDLNKFIKKNEQTKFYLKENIIWNIFLKILLGLFELHKNKILHRDLKPLNIFLSKNNFDIKIGDFGSAKMLDKNNLAKTIIGTPHYLSPELCEELPYNDKSDIWALGCILYELCTYKHPFKAKCQASLILKILKHKQKPIHEYYSNDLQKLIDLMLEKNYVKRPSCSDILSLSFVKEKLKEFGLYDKIELSYLYKNYIKRNYSNGNNFSARAHNLNNDKRNENCKLFEKKISQKNYIYKTIDGKKHHVLIISKSTDNFKKLKIIKEENKNNNGLILPKEPKDNYKNYINKNDNNIPNKIKNNINEYEAKIKNEKRINNINKYPKDKKPNLSFLDLENDEEIFKNIKTSDILNNKEIDKMINIKLAKMKKEQKKININDFASFLNNNISKNNLINSNDKRNKPNNYEYKYKRIKDKSKVKMLNFSNNYSFDIIKKQKNDSFKKIEIKNTLYNKTNKNIDAKKYKIKFNNNLNQIEEKKTDSKIMKKNHSFLEIINKNKKILNKNRIKNLNRINSTLYSNKKIKTKHIPDLTNK